MESSTTIADSCAVLALVFGVTMASGCQSDDSRSVDEQTSDAGEQTEASDTTPPDSDESPIVDSGPIDAEEDDEASDPSRDVDDGLPEGWTRHPVWCDAINGSCCDEETGEFVQKTETPKTTCSACPPGTTPCWKAPPPDARRD